MQRRLVIRVLVILAVALIIYLRGPEPGQDPQGDRPVPPQPAESSDTGLPAERPTLEISDSPGPQDASSSSGEAPPEQSDELLKEIGNDRYESPAGLIYGPGSVDEHRLAHVMKHRSDDPDKPIHGVFQGSESEVLQLIDEAFRLARQGGNRIRSDPQNRRIAYTVDMQRDIGFVGGQVGKRKNHPECRFVKLVLEDENVVVTAYPTESF